MLRYVFALIGILIFCFRVILYLGFILDICWGEYVRLIC